MKEYRFKTPQSMIDISCPHLAIVHDVVVCWTIFHDVRESHIESIYNAVNRIEGTLVLNDEDEELDSVTLDLSKFKIINELDDSAIGIDQIIFNEDEEIVYVQ